MFTACCDYGRMSFQNLKPVGNLIGASVCDMDVVYVSVDVVFDLINKQWAATVEIETQKFFL